VLLAIKGIEAIVNAGGQGGECGPGANCPCSEGVMSSTLVAEH